MKRFTVFSAVPSVRAVPVLAALILAAAVLLSFCSCAKEDKPLPEAGSGEVSASGESAAPEESAASEESAVSGESAASEESVDVSSVLRGKTALFVGDSLCSALVYDTEHPHWGWAERIGQAFGMKEVMNEAKDGASVSNCRGKNVVAVQLEMYEGDPIDFVVLEGGGNDGWDSAEAGRVTPEGTENFDLSTYAGGLEDLFRKARASYPGAHIGYVFNYRFHTERGRMADMSEYLAAAKEVCAKWGMPMLNLYEDEAFNRECDTASELYSPDGIHLCSAGYDLIAPKIAEFMASLAS